MNTKEDSTSRAYPASRKRNRNGKWLILGILVLALIVIGAAIFVPRLSSGHSLVNMHKQTQTPTNPAPIASSPSIGPQNAPVTIIEYADFGCPSCEFWYKMGVLDQLLARYGNKIRFIWRDYAVITLLSPQAAQAGQCANDQGKFWQFHDAVYQHDGAIQAGNLAAYAKSIGLQMDQFNKCVATQRYRERVNAEQTEAFTHGYNGAPFFLINNRVLIGPQSAQVFESIIDPILASQ